MVLIHLYFLDQNNLFNCKKKPKLEHDAASDSFMCLPMWYYVKKTLLELEILFCCQTIW